MKNLIIIAFSFFALNAVAQTETKSNLTFGGINTGSTVSMMQLRDYPVLLSKDKSKKIKSYIFSVFMDDSYGPETFKLSGPALDQAAINYLESAMNKSGEIWIENIIYEGSETAAKEEKLIFYYNQ